MIFFAIPLLALVLGGLLVAVGAGYVGGVFLGIGIFLFITFLIMFSVSYSRNKPK